MFLYNIVTSTKFDIAIAVIISLNVVTMAIEFYQMPPVRKIFKSSSIILCNTNCNKLNFFFLQQELVFTLKIFNYIFTIVFTAEFIVKIVAFGPRLYFIDHWNKLDVVIVLLSYVGILLEELGSGILTLNPTIIRVMRMLRVARCTDKIIGAISVRH